jgi:hypothetical protein
MAPIAAIAMPIIKVVGAKLLTGTAAKVIGTGLAAYGTIRKGQAQKQMSEAVAQQQEAAGNAEAAASQREAAELRRVSNIKRSRALAVAGASGTSVVDPDVVNVLAGFDYEGDYASKVALYSGNEAMRMRTAEAGMSRYEGDLAKQNSIYKAGATILTGTGDILRKKYALGDKPYGSDTGTYKHHRADGLH